jgi:hypothetical protein
MLFILTSVHTSHSRELCQVARNFNCRVIALLYLPLSWFLMGPMLVFYFCTSTSSIPLVDRKYAAAFPIMLVIIKPEDVMFE